MPLIIYHNTRCSKSRNALRLIEEKGIPYEVRFYMQSPLTKPEFKALLAKLGVQPSALLRKGEAIYKEYKGRGYSEEKWLELMIQYPQLMERPIVAHGDRAVIARPPERLLEILPE